MNKLIVPLTVVSLLGLFNAYSSFAQSKTENTENKQSAKQHCASAGKESCCKTEKAQPNKCCACCTGPTCTAHGSKCCGS